MHSRRVDATATVVADWEPQDQSELRLRAGEELVVLKRDSSGWWTGRNARSEEGLFPVTYVDVKEPSPGAAAARPNSGTTASERGGGGGGGESGEGGSREGGAEADGRVEDAVSPAAADAADAADAAAG